MQWPRQVRRAAWREAALWLVSHEGGELVCPVLLSNSPDRYARVLGELPLLVIDGCATQCATKLANRLGVKIARKLQVAEEVKTDGCDPLQIAHAGSG